MFNVQCSMFNVQCSMFAPSGRPPAPENQTHPRSGHCLPRAPEGRIIPGGTIQDDHGKPPGIGLSKQFRGRSIPASKAQTEAVGAFSGKESKGLRHRVGAGTLCKATDSGQVVQLMLDGKRLPKRSGVGKVLENKKIDPAVKERANLGAQQRVGPRRKGFGHGPDASGNEGAGSFGGGLCNLDGGPIDGVATVGQTGGLEEVGFCVEGVCAQAECTGCDGRAVGGQNGVGIGHAKPLGTGGQDLRNRKIPGHKTRGQTFEHPAHGRSEAIASITRSPKR
jgi:hypothetical protein